MIKSSSSCNRRRHKQSKYSELKTEMKALKTSIKQLDESISFIDKWVADKWDVIDLADFLVESLDSEIDLRYTELDKLLQLRDNLKKIKEHIK